MCAGHCVAFAVAAVLMFLGNLHAQSILTVAGGGPIGDGGSALGANLKSPQDVAFDAAGNMYIADQLNHRVRKVDAKTGTISTYAGGATSGKGDGGPATSAEVHFPQALAFDKQGNLFIATAGAPGGVRRVDGTTGIITTYAGGGAWDNDPVGRLATDSDLHPYALAFDLNGDLLLSDQRRARVYRVNTTTHVVSAVAGNGSPDYAGDGGPATAAGITPSGLAVDPSGNIFISDGGRNGGRVRRIDHATGTITTYAGNGTAPGQCCGDPAYVGPATGTLIYAPSNMVVDSAGNLYISDLFLGRVLFVDAKTQNLRTYSGSGNASSDGKPALETAFSWTRGLAFDAGGNLYIAEEKGGRVRRVDKTTTIATTAAGGTARGDGGPAIAAQLSGNYALAIDAAGNLYAADTLDHRIRRIDRLSGAITTVAGNGVYAGFDFTPSGPATAVPLSLPYSVAIDGARNALYVGRQMYLLKVDLSTGAISTLVGWKTPLEGGADAIGIPSALAVGSNGDVYFADPWNHRVRKYQIATGAVITVAGIGPNFPNPGGYSGDGGPATSAQLNGPQAIAFDRRGNLYIGDQANSRIRVVDPGGTIRLFAGNGQFGNGGDGGTATAAMLADTDALAIDSQGNVYVTQYGGTIRRIDGQTGIITTAIGAGEGYTGDGGPALQARLGLQMLGLAFDGAGNLFISDTDNNRIRAVYACVSQVGTPAPSTPNDGASSVSISPTLQWNAVAGGFRYDVYLDTKSPPATVVASNLTGTTFSPSNLAPGVKYYWQVVAKADPFCTPSTTAASPILSFTTTGGCPAPQAFSLTAPSNGATNLNGPIQLGWTASPGASTYDVYFGPSNPPPLVVSGTTTLNYTVQAIAPQTTYNWYVIAHSSCDPTKTTATATRSFTSAGTCAPAGAFGTLSPQSGATQIPTTVTFTWSPSPNVSSYDVYLGTTNPPPIYLVDVQKTQVAVSGLAPGGTYYWKVVAKVACDATKSISTTVATFTTSGVCPPPRTPTITFVPVGNVGVGETYTIAWQEMAELDATSYYIVERSLTRSFTSVLDSQQTFSTTASFVANIAGTYYHRVRAIRSCDPANPGPNSDVKPVVVVTGTANVIFTVQPQAVVTKLGDKLEDQKSLFTLENLGASSVQVVIGKGEINSVPFFTIVDPSGGDSVFTTLAPRTPKTFEIHYSGPPNDQPGAYQGLVFLAATGQGLAITPYAFVNLKVGGGTTARPMFLSNGAQTEYAFFPGYSGDDGARPPISIDIRNGGSTPMELGAEIGPEVWLVPQSGWNASPIAPGTTRTVQLRTARSRAPNGSALPRYTYFTVRSRSGETARLLVQDNDALLTSAGRTSLLNPGSRSYIVPGVTSTTYNGAPAVTRLRMTNIGSEAVQTELFFTPAGSDGFEAAAVKRATLVVPPNDVVTLTDPLVQVFGLAPPVQGQIEVRAAPEQIGFLLVAASVSTAVPTGGSQTYQLPTVRLGEGARVGSPHSVAGVLVSASMRVLLVLAETSGTDASTIKVALFEATGTKLGETTATVSRYGASTIDVATIAGGATVNGGRIDITSQSGGGSVVGTLLMLDATRNSGSTTVSQPIATAASSSAILRLQKRAGPSGGLVTAVAPVVVNGPSAPGSQTSYRTSMGFTTSGASSSAIVTYRPNDPAQPSISKTVPVVPNVVLNFDNVLEQLFGIASGSNAAGSMYVGADAGAQIYSRLATSTGGGPWRINSSLPLFPSVAEVMTTVASMRPLYLDGLEQSTESTRGARWAVVLDETSGNAGTVTVRLYEAGNRSLPIAEKTLSVRGWEQVRLDTIFAALGLDTNERRKDRTNVLCVITPESGSGVFSAIGVSTDNATGNTNVLTFSPTGGVPATGVLRLSIVTPVVASSTSPASRRRVVNP